MAVAQEPRPFLALACDELVRTLGFPWVALRLRPPLDRFAESDGIMLAGEVPVSRDGIRDLATRMLLTCGAEGPRVLPRGHPVLAESALDGPVIVCPLRREDRAIGVLLAGDRDGEIVSAELKLVDATAGHLGLYLENASLYRDLDAMFLGTLEALVATIDAKDPYTRGHSQRVAALSRELGRRIGLDDASLKRVHIAGLVHDVGKIGVAEAVLRKPGRLDEEEFAQIRQHPEIGWRILKDIPQFERVLDGVLWHHERWDGRGYPHGLRGAAIPLFARIIALADSFDAMSTDRTYRVKRSGDEVLGEIVRCAGSQFDPELAGQFVGLDFSEYHQLRREHEDLEVEVRRAA
jgi:HD-GYP domain-containing protein (c-di-GMP phosphodiesterase class II)